jgi:predicted N-acetyltransferase YhbS
MTPADLKAVCQVDRDAFEAYRRQQRQLTHPLRLRTPENMNAAIRRPHPGVVVESPPGRIAGYCFTHHWGTLGWLGTLGVTPPRQGLGLGRAVIAAGLDLLREIGCQTLALETMPESGKIWRSILAWALKSIT